MVMQILGLLKNISFIRLKAFNFSIHLNVVTFDLNFMIWLQSNLWILLLDPESKGFSY